ncbi:MAG: lipoprotein [Bacteroidales bacterium]|nr:lipoprotein [Bacteroidales bacterium]MBQ1832093.1 lipoprotein [Bacteroidales bacterium]MBQ5434852.1 lipoprotein [Bacteroidales bacterium]MBQ5438457.1 lipoprotein [Bacteroidales bacterium]MBQ5482348.1 lipoprotein [Bacteroidales bacterium]
MKKIILLASLVLALSSCGSKNADPLASAIADALTRDIDQPCKIHVRDIQKLDSTNFITEFKRRINIYEIRLDQNTGRLEKYIKEGKTNNATKVFGELQRDTKIYNELLGLKEMMADDTLKTAYYDYTFVYQGKVGDQRISATRAYCTVTPDGRVLTYGPEQKVIHKGTGIVIPGYQDLLDSFKEKAEE